MNPLAIAQLLAQLLPLGIQLYKEIQSANSGTLPPVETILAAADANWDAVIFAAQAELNKAAQAPTGPLTFKK